MDFCLGLLQPFRPLKHRRRRRVVAGQMAGEARRGLVYCGVASPKTFATQCREPGIVFDQLRARVHVIVLKVVEAVVTKPGRYADGKILV